MQTHLRNMVKLAIDEANRIKESDLIITNDNSIGEQIKETELLTTVLVEQENFEQKNFQFSAIDYVLIQFPELTNDVIYFINEETDINPLELLLAEPSLKTLTLNDVKEATTKLIDLNVSVTNLEIKTLLRDNGFKADQRDISVLMDELYKEGFVKFEIVKGNKPHRLYIAGDNFYHFDLDSLEIYKEDETEETNVVLDSEPKVIKTETQLRNFSAIENRAERNKLILDDSKTMTKKELEIKYNLSDRTIRRIVNGK